MLSMDFETFPDAQGFLNKTQTWLEGREVGNSLMLGIVFRFQNYPERIKTPPFLGCVERAGIVKIAAVISPPHNLVLAGQPDEKALQILVDGLVEQDRPLPGVVGPEQISPAFSSVWAKTTRQGYSLRRRMRLYQLDQVIQPAQVPGYLRMAQVEDVPLLTSWMVAFQVEALNENPNPGEVQCQVELMVAGGQLFVWDNVKPVSMAAAARPTSNGVTVNAVYTPPESRQKGFASACVAALSQQLLDSGYRFCCLFTDLTNPTSNHIYMDIGYQPVCDFEEYHFDMGVQGQSPGTSGG
jgi:uncharacterized protein